MTEAGDVTETILALATVELGLSPDQIDVDTNLRDVHGAESVKLLEIVAAIEATYQIELEDEVVFREVQSIRDLAEAVTALVRAS